jgi:predicted nucleic acid-binding protein
MRTAVDTNVLLAIWDDEPSATNLAEMLGKAKLAGTVVICGAVFAEALAHPKVTEDYLVSFLRNSGVEIDFELEEKVWTEAGRRYAGYAARRRLSGGGETKRLLADLVIGAHALLSADGLMTLDRKRYVKDFPELRLI